MNCPVYARKITNAVTAIGRFNILLVIQGIRKFIGYYLRKVHITGTYFGAPVEVNTSIISPKTACVLKGIPSSWTWIAFSKQPAALSSANSIVNEKSRSALKMIELPSPSVQFSRADFSISSAIFTKKNGSSPLASRCVLRKASSRPSILKPVYQSAFLASITMALEGYKLYYS